MSDVTVSRRIFGSDGPMLRATGNLEPGQQKLALSGEIQGGKNLDALGSTLDFGGIAGVELRLLDGDVDLGPAAPPGATEQLAPLGSFAPPAGKRWSELKLNGGVKVSGSGSTTGGAVTVSVSGKANLGFEYRGVRAVGAVDGPEKAVKTLLANTLMPFSFGLQSFKPKQWHELSFDAALSFSAAVSAGKTLTLDSHSGPLAGLLPEDAPEVAAQINLLAKASLGLELIDSLRVGAGRLPATRPTWVRYRLERVEQRKVSFSASLALELLYNREVLKSILSAALGKVGYPQIQAQLEKIAAAIDPDALTIDNLKSKLSDELFDLAKKVLPIDQATGEIAERAAGLLRLVGEVRDEYAELDGEFQGLVDHYLGSAGLAPGQPLRKALEELQGLGGESSEELVEGFLGGRFGKLEPLIELLATRGVNELLLAGGGALKQQIGRLSAESGKLLGLLDKIDDSDLTDVLEKITGSTRVRKIVDFINSAPDNVADFKSFLEDKVDAELRAWVERLAGRVTQNISQKRLDRLRQWARKVDDALTSAASIDQRLGAEIDKLKDRVGFVASFAIDRISRRTALVDVELDPGSQGCRRAFTSLSHGDLQEFTEKLPFEKDPTGDAADEPDPPFFFHHFVLASDRSTELTWIFAPTIGGGTKRTRKAFDSSRIEIRQQASVARNATYSGGLVLSTGAAREGLLRSWMASIWLRSQAAGSGPVLSDPFDEVEHEIHLTTVRFDDEIDEITRAGLDQLLAFLGFGTNALTSRLPSAATATKVQAELVVTAGAAGEPDPVDRLLAPLQSSKQSLSKSAVLDKDYLAAASGWLSEPLIRDRAGDLPMNVVLPAIVKSDSYRERWRNGPWDQPFVLSKGAQTLRVKPTPESPGSVFAPVLRGIAFSRSWSSGPLARLGRSWAAVGAAGGAVEPSQLVDLARAFRRAVRWSTPALKFWDSPLFQHWLLFSRLDSELGKGQWSATGVAAVSWRLGGDDWQPTQRILIPPPGL